MWLLLLKLKSVVFLGELRQATVPLPTNLDNFKVTDTPTGTNSVQCCSCKKWIRAFRFGFNWKEQNKDMQMTVDDPVTPDFFYKHQCIECYRMEKNVDFPTAMSDLLSQRSSRHSKRSGEFKENRERVMQEITFGASAAVVDGMSGKQIKKLATLPRESLSKLFAPWAQFIRMKA